MSHCYLELADTEEEPIARQIAAQRKTTPGISLKMYARHSI
jgi:hypothetical protein